MNKHEINKELNNLFRTTKYTCLVELNNDCYINDDVIGIALEDSKEKLIDFTEPNNFCKFVILFGKFCDKKAKFPLPMTVINSNFIEDTLSLILVYKYFIDESFIGLIQNEEWK